MAEGMDEDIVEDEVDTEVDVVILVVEDMAEAVTAVEEVIIGGVVLLGPMVKTPLRRRHEYWNSHPLLLVLSPQGKFVCYFYFLTNGVHFEMREGIGKYGHFNSHTW